MKRMSEDAVQRRNICWRVRKWPRQSEACRWWRKTFLTQSCKRAVWKWESGQIKAVADEAWEAAKKSCNIHEDEVIDLLPPSLNCWMGAGSGLKELWRREKAFFRLDLPCAAPEEDMVSSETTGSPHARLFRSTFWFWSPQILSGIWSSCCFSCASLYEHRKDKNLVCFDVFAPAEPWIYTLMILFLHFNFANFLTACCSPPLQLQVSSVANDLALIRTSCFTSIPLLWCISLALASLLNASNAQQLFILSKCCIFKSTRFWAYQLYICTNKTNMIMAVMAVPSNCWHGCVYTVKVS